MHPVSHLQLAPRLRSRLYSLLMYKLQEDPLGTLEAYSGGRGCSG
jgi:hypothetical protein